MAASRQLHHFYLENSSTCCCAMNETETIKNCLLTQQPVPTRLESTDKESLRDHERPLSGKEALSSRFAVTNLIATGPQGPQMPFAGQLAYLAVALKTAATAQFEQLYSVLLYSTVQCQYFGPKQQHMTMI